MASQARANELYESDGASVNAADLGESTWLGPSQQFRAGQPSHICRPCALSPRQQAGLTAPLGAPIAHSLPGRGGPGKRADGPALCIDCEGPWAITPWRS